MRHKESTELQQTRCSLLSFCLSEKRKYQLADYLDTNLNQTPKSLFAMEKAQEKLADLRMVLAVEMARARRHINTININVGNAEKLLESSYLIGKKEELDAPFVESVAAGA